MKFRWIEDIQEFREIAPEWDAVGAASDMLAPFLSSDFIIAWWERFNPFRRIMVFVVFDDGGRISGGIPLSLKRAGLGRGFSRVLTYAGGAAANYTEPLYAGDGVKIFRCLLDAIAARNDWDVLYLPDVRQESRLTAEFEAEKNDKRFMLYSVYDHMNWAIDLSGGKEAYLRALSSKLKRDLRSKRKRLEENYGRLRLEVVSGSREVSDLFCKYKEFSLKAFSSRGRKSAFAEPLYADFFRSIIIGMEKRGLLTAHALIAGDKITAVSFGYNADKRFDWILTAFDYDYRYYRPGYILIEELIGYITERGGISYNWYGHERFYKSQWCNAPTPLMRLHAARRTPGGYFYKYAERAERIMRSNSLLLTAARKLKGA
ncbi:MAG: GNAT family N-acetyltransferase [Candidatus Omnitrophota bacterium]|nr:GNAT family N-acetyltransferase [Candidatus Omnitrophota bacterium]